MTLVIQVILRFLEVFRRNTWSSARVNIHGLHSVANQFVTIPSHRVSLPVLHSPVTQDLMAHPGGVHSPGAHSCCHSGSFVWILCSAKISVIVLVCLDHLDYSVLETKVTTNI